MSPRAANLLLLITAAVWGAGFVAQETAMEDLGPFMFTGLRFFLAGLVVLPFVIWEQGKAGSRISAADFKRFLPLGIVFFLALVLQQIGLLTTSVTNAGFLTALYVIFVPIILLVGLRERQSAIIWPAALLALGGVYLLSGGSIEALVAGDWLVIVGAFFGAVHVILISRFGKASRRPVTLATMQFLIAGCLGFAGYFAAPFVGVVEQPVSMSAIWGALPEIIYAGVFSGAFAFSLMAIAQQYTDAASAAILMSSESLFAALFAALLLSEVLAPIAYVGCGLIFCALLLVELVPAVSKRRVG